MVEHDFVCYKTLNEELSFDNWVERMKSIVEDLDWLLRLSHDKFWNQVDLILSIDSLITFCKQVFSIFYKSDELCKFYFVLLVVGCFR